MARRTFTVIDVEIMSTGTRVGRRSTSHAAWASTARRSAGMSPRRRGRDGPGRPAGERGAVAEAGPGVVPEAGSTPGCVRRPGARSRFTASASPSLVGVVPVSVIHQRLVDEHGPGGQRGQLAPLRAGALPRGGAPGEVSCGGRRSTPGDEAQVDYGYLGTWADPTPGKRRRVWAFSMVLSYSRHLFVLPGAAHGPAGLGRRPRGRRSSSSAGLPGAGSCSTTFGPG